MGLGPDQAPSWAVEVKWSDRCVADALEVSALRSFVSANRKHLSEPLVTLRRSCPLGYAARLAGALPASLPSAARVLPTSNRLRLLLLLLVLGTGFIAVRRALQEDNDFDGFHRAGALVLEHGQLSDEKAVARYLPSFPVLMAPFGALPLGVAAALWFLLNVAAMAALPRELERLTGVPPAGQRAAFLVAAPFLVDNLILGQSAPLLMWLVTAGVARGRQRRGITSGALIGFAAAIKVLPVALLVVPLALGRAWRVLLGFALAVTLVTGVCALAVGTDELRRGLADWQAVVTDQTPQRMVELDRSLRHGNQAIPIVLFRTLGDDSVVREEFAPKLARLPADVVWLLAAVPIGLALLLGLGAALAALRPAERAAERLFALVCLGMLFVSPLVWTHYFLWVLPGVLAIRHRPKLVLWGGWIYALALAVEPLRSLGLHMLGAWLLFLLVAFELLAAARAGSARAQPVS